MELLCPSCEKKLLLKLDPDVYCTTWCGTCNQEIPPEILTEAGVAADVVKRLPAWGRMATELLSIEDDWAVGDDREDAEYVKDWKAFRDETRDLLARLRQHVPAGTNVFGAPKPPDWTDEEIVKWRRQRQRESYLYHFGYQSGARHVEQEAGLPLDDGDELPVDYPVMCVTPSEKKLYRSGFVLGTQTGTFDRELYLEFLAKLKGKK